MEVHRSQVSQRISSSPSGSNIRRLSLSIRQIPSMECGSGLCHRIMILKYRTCLSGCFFAICRRRRGDMTYRSDLTKAANLVEGFVTMMRSPPFLPPRPRRFSQDCLPVRLSVCLSQLISHKGLTVPRDPWSGVITRTRNEFLFTGTIVGLQPSRMSVWLELETL